MHCRSTVQRSRHVWEGHEHYPRGEQAYISTARPASLYGWRAQSRSFESITAYRWRPMLLTHDKRPELVPARDVHDQFFEPLGTLTHLRRALEARDYEPSAAHVVVIRNAMWGQSPWRGSTSDRAAHLPESRILRDCRRDALAELLFESEQKFAVRKLI